MTFDRTSALAAGTPGAIAARLRSARQVAIFTHQRPDPDALGSQTAAALLLGRLGIEATILHLTDFSSIYRFIPQAAPGNAQVHFTEAWGASHEPDTILIVDTCSWSQLEPARSWLETRGDKTLVIDHHRTFDLLAPMIWSDPTAAACVELIAHLAGELELPIDSAMAMPLMAGLVADTGWFRFDSVTARTHRLAAELVAAGAGPARIAEQLMQQESPTRLALMARALGTLSWHSGGRVGCMSLSAEDFAAVGAAGHQSEGFVDLPLQVAGVEVSCFFSVQSDGLVRVNLRSKHNVDVSSVCKEFGGGGHAKASGCRIQSPLPEARDKVLGALARALA